MFDWLRELFTGLREKLSLWSIIDVGRGGVHYRCGKIVRVIGPGLWWKWPYFDKIEDFTTNITTERFDEQTLETKDGKQKVVRATVRYSIEDLGAYVTHIFDQKEVLQDTGMGAIQEWIEGHTAEEFDSVVLKKEVATTMRYALHPYGFKIHWLKLTDCASIPTVRLMTTGHAPVVL